MLARDGDTGACWVGVGQQWRHGCVLARNGDMGACWVGVGQQWKHGCVGWVLIKHGDGMCVVWVLHQWRWSVRWVGADQPWRWSVRCVGADCSAVETTWRHGCVLAGCSSAVEARVCACWVLTSNGDMGVCLFGAEQQRTHE